MVLLGGGFLENRYLELLEKFRADAVGIEGRKEVSHYVRAHL